MDTTLLTPLGFYLLGATLSIVLPYLQEWVESQVPFDGRYLIGRLLALGATLLTTAFTPAFFDSLRAMAQTYDLFTLAFVTITMGWGVSQIGRQADKLISHLSSK